MVINCEPVGFYDRLQRERSAAALPNVLITVDFFYEKRILVSWITVDFFYAIRLT